jgi:hypothetical protein
MSERPTMANSVLGIDVGWSLKNKSSAVCLLEWAHGKVFWHIERFRAVEAEYLPLLRKLTMEKHPLSAVFDGPLSFIAPWAKDVLLKNDREFGGNRNCYWS